MLACKIKNVSLASLVEHLAQIDVNKCKTKSFVVTTKTHIHTRATILHHRMNPGTQHVTSGYPAVYS